MKAETVSLLYIWGEISRLKLGHVAPPAVCWCNWKQCFASSDGKCLQMVSPTAYEELKSIYKSPN